MPSESIKILIGDFVFIEQRLNIIYLARCEIKRFVHCLNIYIDIYKFNFIFIN